MSYIEPLISKIIDDNAVPTLDSLGLDRDFFPVGVERDAYDFVRKYSTENAGQAPSYAAIVTEIPDFTYVPDVTDSYTYMETKIKETWAMRATNELMTGSEHVAKFSEIGRTITFVDYNNWLTDRLNKIKMRTSVRKTVGTDIVRDSSKFTEEYEKRLQGESNRIWRSKFPTLNKAVGGGYYSSNMYVVYARSGRGKSIITMEEAIEFAFQGAVVLIWALEMGSFEWMARAFTSISGRLGITVAKIDGVDYDAGFDNRALQSAQLDEEYYAAFKGFLAQLNEIVPGRIILRATNDLDFTDRSLLALRRDIIETGADVVVVDPFYYLDYERNSSKTTGGDAAETSRKLRIMTGQLDVVMIAITQADEDSSEKVDGVRELKLPERDDVLKTKQLLQDGTLLIGIDTLAHEGRGVIGLGKGRSGGEDTTIEILYLPNYGIVREPDIADVASKFVGNF